MLKCLAKELTCDIDLPQALHERDLHGTQHLVAAQPGDDLGLRALHHQHTVAVHAAHVQVVAPRTDPDAAGTGRLAPHKVGDEVARSEGKKFSFLAFKQKIFKCYWSCL